MKDPKKEYTLKLEGVKDFVKGHHEIVGFKYYEIIGLLQLEIANLTELSRQVGTEKLKHEGE
jgi:hypothetical protein